MYRLQSCAFAMASLLVAACQPVTPDVQTAGTESADGGKVIFFDDFNDGKLDKKKWNVEGPVFWVNNEEQAYIDSPDTINFEPAGAVEGADNGVLVLRPQYRKDYKTPTGRSADFVSGRINTSGKFEFTYGRATARIRMPDARGVWPAFWLLGKGEWPQTGEIDIMEYVGEADWSAVALHGPGYSGDTPLVKRYYFPDETDVTEWHEYAVQWSPDEIVFMVDDNVFYRVTKAMVEQYGPWRYDTPEYVILNFAVGGIYPAKTNNIEKPYPGLPAETVERIKAGELAMEVDWVRVTAQE